MLGRRFGIGTKGGVALSGLMVTAFGLTMLGCPGGKPDVDDKTPLEVASGLVKDAKSLATDPDVTEAKLDEATGLLDKALAQELTAEEKAKIETEVAALREQITAKKEALAEAARAKEIADKVAKAQEALDVNDLDEAEKLAKEALEAEPGNAAATAILAKVAEARKPPADDAAKLYAEKKAQYDAALRRGNYAQCKGIIADIERHVGPGRPSLKGQLPKIESLELYARAERLARSSNVSALKSAERLLEQAVQKDRDNSKAKSLLAEVKEKIRVQDEEREVMDLVRRAESELDRRNFSAAERSLRDASGKARSSGAKRRVSDAERRVSGHKDFDRLVKEGDSAAARDDLAGAKSKYEEARRVVRSTRSPATWASRESGALRGKIDGLDRKQALKDAKAAEAAGDYLKAAPLYERGGDRAKAMQMRKLAEGADTAKELDDIRAAIKAKQFMSVKPRLERLAGQDNAEAQDLLKAGPSKDELKDLDAAANKLYVDTKKAVAKITSPATVMSRWKAVLPRMEYTKCQKKVEGEISKAADSILKGVYDKAKADEAKIKPTPDKIRHWEGVLPRLADSAKYTKMVESTIQKYKDALAAGAYKKDGAAIGAAKKDADKIAKIDAALAKAVYAGTKYEKTLQDARKKARDNQIKASKAYQKLSEDMKKAAKSPAKLLALLQSAVANPLYAGSSYVDKWNADIKKQEDAKIAADYKKLMDKVKKARTPQLAILNLQGERGNFSGKYVEQIDGMIEAKKAEVNAAALKKIVDGVKKEKNAARRMDMINTGLAQLTDKKSQDTLKKMLETEKTDAMKAPYAKLKQDLAKQKTDQAKLALLKQEIGKYQGTTLYKSLEAQVKGLEKKLAPKPEKKKPEPKAKKAPKKKPEPKAKKAPKKKPEPKAKKAPKEKPEKKKPEPKAKKAPKKKPEPKAKKAPAKKPSAAEKKAAAEAAKKKDAAAKKDYDAVKKALNAKPKVKADCDANIAKLQDAKLKVAGTKYAGLIDKEIKKQEGLKKKMKK